MWQAERLRRATGRGTCSRRRSRSSGCRRSCGRVAGEHDGWRFEQARTNAPSGRCALVDGDLPRDGRAAVADRDLALRERGRHAPAAPESCCSTFSCSARLRSSPPMDCRAHRRGPRRLDAAVWVRRPGSLHALNSYDPTLRDRVLPLALGLTPEPGYPAGVALARPPRWSAVARRRTRSGRLAGSVAAPRSQSSRRACSSSAPAAGRVPRRPRVPEASSSRSHWLPPSRSSLWRHDCRRPGPALDGWSTGRSSRATWRTA